jgi:hypothetical protein
MSIISISIIAWYLIGLCLSAYFIKKEIGMLTFDRKDYNALAVLGIFGPLVWFLAKIHVKPPKK